LAHKDSKIARENNLKDRVDEIIGVLEEDPYRPVSGHKFERLKGKLKGKCSRRLNEKHRMIYEVLPNTDRLKDPNGNLYDGIVVVASMWTHKYKK
jgi:Txe/YoeB family toxin of toxin-antitoxin system